MSLSATGIPQIDFEGGGGGDTFTINNLAKTSVTTVGINLSEAGHDAGGGDKVVINGDPQGADQVQISAAAAQTGPGDNNPADKGVVTDVRIQPGTTGDAGAAAFSVLAAIPDNSDSLTLNTGAGNDTITVSGTQPDVTAPKPGGQVFVNAGRGTNSITVGGSGNVDTILSVLTVQASAGINNLTINDQTGGKSARRSRGVITWAQPS